MLFNYFAISSLFAATFALSFTDEVPTNFPIDTVGESLILHFDPSTSGITYPMATKLTDSKVIHLDFTPADDKDLQLKFEFPDFTLTLSPESCNVNGGIRILGTGAVKVDIDFGRREVKCNDIVYFYEGTSDVDADQYISFNVTFETDLAASAVCIFAKGAIWFPIQAATTTESTMPSTSSASNEVKKGMSTMAITGTVVGCVAGVVALVVIGIAITVFVMKRRGIGLFKKPEPELPSYVASESQQVVGIPHDFECPARELWLKQIKAEREKMKHHPNPSKNPRLKLNYIRTANMPTSSSTVPPPQSPRHQRNNPSSESMNRIATSLLLPTLYFKLVS